MTSDIGFLPARDLAAAVRRGERSAVDVADAFLGRIADRDDDVNAFITVADDHAREAAERVDRAVADGEDPGPLAGVPVALKDLTAFRAGVRHTFGCAAFEDHVPDHTAPFVERLEAAGAVVVGKTNLPEFGHRPKTVNPRFGPTATPFDLDCNAGGSSGGSAAAVADGMAALAQGGDAAGSVRIPAALCGVFGLKPTFGRIPSPARPDAFQNATPFIDKGPIARTVDDAALALDVMAGPHPDDPFSLPDGGSDFSDAVGRPVDGLRVAYSPDLGAFPVEAEVRSTVEAAVGDLADAGATVERVDVDFGHSLGDLRDRGRNVAMEVLSAGLARNLEAEHGVDFRGADSDTVSAEFKRRIEAGRDHSAMAYKEVDLVRTDVLDEFNRVFDDYDLLASPTLGTAGVSHDPDGPTQVAGTEVDPFADWVLTWPYNFTGQPAASVPAGLTDGGLPIGLQLGAPKFEETAILTASATLERARPWAETYPGR